MTREGWIAMAVALALLAAGVTTVLVVSARSGRLGPSGSSGSRSGPPGSSGSSGSRSGPPGSSGSSGSRSGPPAPPPLPESMAAVGDSLTAAFDLDGGHLFQDRPEQSWSTGSDPSVASHYSRIRAVMPAIAGHAFNDARDGAKMAALDAQMTTAAGQEAEYVTVLMGANDLCAVSVAAMTPTSAFETQFDQALGHFFTADAGAHVLVASIPDLFRLWDTLRSDPAARTIWALAKICPPMLSLAATPADRDAVVAQERADNATLATVCARYPNCRSDRGALYRAPFDAGEVSSVDFFHPSPIGQQKLAAVTWAAGYWP